MSKKYYIFDSDALINFHKRIFFSIIIFLFFFSISFEMPLKYKRVITAIILRPNKVAIAVKYFILIYLFCYPEFS